MFARLAFPPGWTLRFDLDPAETPLSVAITFFRNGKQMARMSVGPDVASDLPSLQALIDMVTTGPGVTDEIPSITEADIPEEDRHLFIFEPGKPPRATPEFFAQSTRMMRCVGGPLDGQIVGVRGVASAWTEPGTTVSNVPGVSGGDPIDPPPGGVYHIHPSGTTMEWIADGEPRGKTLPFARSPKKPRR